MVHTALPVIDMQHLIDLFGRTGNNPQAEHQALRVLGHSPAWSSSLTHSNIFLTIPNHNFITNRNQVFKSDFDSCFELSFKKRLIAPLLEQILKHIYEQSDLSFSRCWFDSASVLLAEAGSKSWFQNLYYGDTASFTLSNKNGPGHLQETNP